MNYVVSRISESSLVIWNGFLPKKLIRIFLNGLIGFFRFKEGFKFGDFILDSS